VVRRYTVPLALVLVLLSGIGPVIAWRRATPRNVRRLLGAPALAALAAIGAGGLAGGVGHAGALLMFGCAAFALTIAAQEFWARRGRAQRRHGPAGARRAVRARAPQPPPLRRLHRPHRNRGAAHRRRRVVELPARRGRAAAARPVGARRRLRAALHRARTASVSHDPRATGAIMSLGAVLDVRRDGRHVATLRPERGYFPEPTPQEGSVGRLIAGEPTSEVALRSGLRRDLWAAITPDIGFLGPIITRANQRIPMQRGDLALATLGLIRPATTRSRSPSRSSGSSTPRW